jgi:hypothetical protein
MKLDRQHESASPYITDGSGANAHQAIEEAGWFDGAGDRCGLSLEINASERQGPWWLRHGGDRKDLLSKCGVFTGPQAVADRDGERFTNGKFIIRRS